MKERITHLSGLVKHSKLLNGLIKLALSLAAFWFALHKVDFMAFASTLKNQDHRGITEAVAMMILQIILGGMRWRLILKALSATGKNVMTRWEALKLVYIGAFFNCCLPGTVGGDVVRVWLAKSDHIPLPVAINSVIIDRMIALIAVGLLVVVTMPLLSAAIGFNTSIVWGVMVVGAVFGLWVLKHIERLLTPWKDIHPVRWLLYFTHCLQLLFKHHAASAVSLIYALLAHTGYCIAVYALAQSLGITISILQCITLVPLVVLVTTLPISVGGWGVREAGMVSMLGLAGVSQAAALALSIQLGLLNIFINLPAGLLWLGYRKRQGTPPA